MDSKTYHMQNVYIWNNIPSLELRRLHLDLIFCYKIMFGLVCVNPGEFFTFSSVSQTRGHPYKLYKSRCTNTVRHNSFIGRVVNVWNALPSTVNFSSLLTFKSSLRNVDFSSYRKVILLSSTLTFWQGALSNITFIIFAVFGVWNNSRLW